MMKSNIEIRILETTNVIGCVSVIRAYTKESIMDIKNKITGGKIVICCEYIEHPEELEQVYEVIKTLKTKGAKVEIKRNFEGISQIIELEIVDNLIQSDKLIAKEIEELKDMELES